MRKGVTLLEVLFAIAIAAIGILGVAMTLVLAGRQATEGHVADMADRIGRNAIREISVRGLDQAIGDNGMWAAVPIDGHAYCLDPIGVSANQANTEFAFFPAVDPIAVPGPRMHRISVRSFPGNQSVAPLSPIEIEMSRSICMGDDDLVFHLPVDKTLPPIQEFGATKTKRQSDGTMSWFATFRSHDYRHGIIVMYVAVCYRRDPMEPERLLTVERIDDENPTIPAVIHPGQARGRTIKIGLRSGQPTSDLKVADGDWILLAGQRAGTTSFNWCRVNNISSILPAGTADKDGYIYGVDTRDLTLFGKDWLYQRQETCGVIPEHVVGVYEKTYRLNDAGLWR